MEQITIKFSDVQIKKMKIRMDKNECKSLAQCVRELVDLAQKIEEMAEKKEENSEETNQEKLILQLLKNMFKTNLESKFYLQFLFQNSDEIDHQLWTACKEKAKETAENMVEELLQSE